jgi:hypothetical protein
VVESANPHLEWWLWRQSKKSAAGRN